MSNCGNSQARLFRTAVGLAILIGICSSYAPGGEGPEVGGLVVRIGADGADALAKPSQGPGRVVHILDRDEGKVHKLRQSLRRAGVYGSVSADVLNSDRLPYADNLVRLLIVASPSGIEEAEMLRVLCPLGLARIAEADGWREIRKPLPEAMDEWTHGEYDASNHTVSADTLVAPPQSIQWIGDPKWTRQHEAMSSLNVMVSAGGRVFYIVDEGPAAAVEAPAQWKLCARDAFSGVTLWKRPIAKWVTHYWPWKSGPSTMVRRLVAMEDEVYAPQAIDQDVAAFDAATGKLLRTYAGTRAAEEFLRIGETLVVATAPEMEDPDKTEEKYLAERRANRRFDSVQGIIRTDHESPRRIQAFDVTSGKRLWQIDTPLMHMTLTALEDRVVFHDGKKLRCVSLAQGKPIWSSPTPETRGPYFVEVTPTLTLHEGLVFYAWNGTLSVHDLGDGKQRWDSDFPKYDYRSPASCYVVNGLVWKMNITRSHQKSEMIGLDPRTGQEKVRFSRKNRFGLNHHRCHKTKATEKYLLTGMYGVEFVDPARQSYVDHNWVRGACLYGFMPANGLLYMPPHSCACNVEEKLNGMVALSPQSVRPEQPEAPTLRGPAWAKVESSRSGPDQWPMYRAEAGRSGKSEAVLPPELQPRWQVELGEDSTPPVAAEGAVLVAQPEAYSVVCVDASGGQKRWQFTAGGRVDSPPTIDAGRAIFGCADGWVYCLRLTDGELVWKTRIAPANRLIVVRDRLESAWPVNGSLIVRDGVIHAVSGRSTYTDGGMELVRLDALSGQVLSRTPLRGESLSPKDKPVGSTYGYGSLQDLLVASGDELFMRNIAFDTSGKVKQSSSPHVYAAGGFLDTQWHYRHYWSFGPWQHATQVGYRNWHSFGEKLPSGRILVFDENRVYGFGRDRFPGKNTHQFVTGEKYQLFAARKGRAGRSRNVWATEPPFHATALALAGQQAGQTKTDVLIAAGPRGDTLCDAPAWEGKTGGKLLIADRADGRILLQQDLDAAPVVDGLAAAGDCLYIVTQDARLICLGSEKD